ncbi:DUF4259 domain-containing protein [Catenulispora rubra]|uniref:DUF4259 domain-containing protein n=1 Tax=Catenulispora rubra TaxID=280293 RepID=UPI00189287DD|nr:DUF4259 domain-containing protein [Catenulispora rubra]
MGFWDAGPFDNDDAADFSGRLDDLPQEDRAAAIREALREAADCDGYLEGDTGAYAIAAAALVARELSDGARFVAADYGPKQPLPPLTTDLLPLAIAAIDRTMADDSELGDEWSGVDGSDSPWHEKTRELRAVLAAD